MEEHAATMRSVARVVVDRAMATHYRKTGMHVLASEDDHVLAAKMTDAFDKFLAHNENRDRVFRLFDMKQLYLQNSEIASSIYKTRIVQSLNFKKHTEV
jgi:hypothetical protein